MLKQPLSSETMKETHMNSSPLLQLVQALASGALKIVDLTQMLSPQTPVLQLPEQFGQCAPFQLQEVSRYDERGLAWYWKNFSCNEHTGSPLRVIALMQSN